MPKLGASPSGADDLPSAWPHVHPPSQQGTCGDVRIDDGISSTEMLELTDPRWADFVAGQPAATPFHHPDWGALVAHCYGFRAFAVATSDATGQIRAACR